MTHIDPARFAAVLSDELAVTGKPPAWLTVILAGGIVTVRWGQEMTDRQEISVDEATVIIQRGPPWIARLMTAKRRQRAEMLEAVA